MRWQTRSHVAFLGKESPFQVRAIRLITISIVLASVLVGPLSVAYAAPSSVSTPTSPAIEAKKAEEAAARQELDEMRSALDGEVREYLKMSRLLETTRVEISEVATQIAQVDADLMRTRQAIIDRTVEVYRGKQIGILEILLDARSLQDLMVRLNYVTAINSHDARLMTDLRMSRNESAFLRESLTLREQRLADLQQQAELKQLQIEADIDAQQAKATAIGADLAAMIRIAQAQATFQGSAPGADYSPDTLISDSNFRASSSMSVEQIQTFLEQQPGTLATYRAADHNGVMKSAAQMIAEAAAGWGVSPKVILVSLQKEQSLLSKKSPSDNAYDWAMGCGKADSRTFYQYQGFGNQIWWGAQKLNKNAGPWYQGIEMTIDGNTVRPSNSSTYSLYKYTPHLRGTMSFWLLYWRYFGDPLAQPAVVQ